MKVVNVVLSILILLLAIASAVFSYFLFDKRSQLVEGWKKMATTINQSATEMDKGSGTKVGGELTVAALSHENYADLDAKLAKLTTQSRQLIKQRDELAETLRSIGTVAEMNNVGSSDAFKNMATYSTSKDDVVQGVGALIDRRNKIVQSVVEAVRRNLQLTIDANKLRAADQAALNQFSQRLTQFGNERRDFENTLNEIVRQAGGSSLNFSGNNFKGALDQARQAVNGLKGKLDEANRTIGARNQEIQRQKNELNGKNNEIATLKKSLDDKIYQLDGLRGALGLDKNDVLPMPWKPGSPEARKRIVGHVADVSSKYGYIAIDLGTESTVQQELGNKVGEINVNLTPGLEMVVSRGDLAVPTSDFVTKVKLTKVDKNCSIAEPIGEQKDTVQVGDKVWFDIN
ncbi:hypothetical protein FYJ85_06195 [Victivallaceae bacterium BBE-744-WT-12]|jgi:uncharacterized coiled-coil DUF342 family protein|uniref:Uncharacterized protein n=1 Tax=Victivallis lenta TaxID=2606640 RepID=A0A844FZU6_9BACT|nr:hypothetical protein [Victivallis lenta]AVM45934.1 hypothetical protein C5Q97_14945 [Victivallales bacterium CCUG 44730]MBS1452740.1 hypothetical protein [Lentisphaeria bacterium]MBS5531275.1 hypothetical protein [bacterium]MST96636.1 hypothetical protein [Victivallis lenta]HBP07222.1 hypothetical protein [Lentisphaeria bacterium]